MNGYLAVHPWDGQCRFRGPHERTVTLASEHRRSSSVNQGDADQVRQGTEHPVAVVHERSLDGSVGPLPTRSRHSM